MENNFETLGFAFMCDSENGALSAKASIIHSVIKHNAFFWLKPKKLKIETAESFELLLLGRRRRRGVVGIVLAVTNNNTTLW